MKNNISLSKFISYSGMMLALNSLLFLGINYITTNTISLMVLASFFVSVVLIEFGLKNAITYSIATIFMAFLILVNKIHFFEFALAFAHYGIVKSILEKRFVGNLQYFVKFIYASIIFSILYFVTINFVKFDINPIIALISYIAFFIYDYTYSVFIKLYYTHIRKRLFKN